MNKLKFLPLMMIDLIIAFLQGARALLEAPKEESKKDKKEILKRNKWGFPSKEE